MALQISYTHTATGSAYPEAYFKIDNIRMTTTTVVVIGTYFVNEQARIAKKQPVETWTKSFTTENASEDEVLIFNTYFSDDALKLVDASPFVNCYSYIKTLQEFAGAIDV